jgi:hypothetical protein
MATDYPNLGEGYVQTPHPVQGLPRVVRHITGHNAEGKSVFLSTDVGDHHRELVNKTAIANIFYSTNQHPVDLNNDADVKHARENEVIPHHYLSAMLFCNRANYLLGK